MTTTIPYPATRAKSAEPEITGLKPFYTVNGTKENYVIRVELPGVKKEDLEIKLDQSVLTLTGKRTSAPFSNWKVLHRELSDLGYALRLKLNAPVQEDKMTAKLQDGILTLSMPVKETAKPRCIEVK